MAYSDFDLRTAVRTFGLTEVRDVDLFAAAPPVEPSDFLATVLAEFAPVALGVNTEKARSEYIIAPFLMEMKRRAGTTLNVFPGVALDVDRAQGLTGYCDFLVARSDEIYYLVSPVVAVVEAKREDLTTGLGQCAAGMVAIRRFNEVDGTPVPAVYGAVTSGSVWRFLKLQDSTLFIDRTEYYLRDAAKLLGVLVAIARG